MLVGAMIFGGIGQADVPDDAVAIIDAPDEDIVITREEFDRILTQVAAQGRREVPKPGTNAYKADARTALDFLLINSWTEAEAAEQDIDFPQRRVDAQIDEYLQEFGCSPDSEPEDCEEFQRRLEQADLTIDELEEQIGTSFLGEDVQNALAAGAPAPTDEQIEDFYEIFKSDLAEPETRDYRLILVPPDQENPDRPPADIVEAKEQLEEDSSAAAWERVAREFSTDPSKSQGGLREGISEGLLPEPLNTELFDAEEGEIVGPISTPVGWYVFELLNVKPARTKTLDDCAVAGGTPGDCQTVKDQIRSQVRQQVEGQFQFQVQNDFITKWMSRTICAEGFLLAPSPPDPTSDQPSGGIAGCDNAHGQDDFTTPARERELAASKAGVAPVFVGRTAWPKPPNTLTVPIGAVGISGTQILCYLLAPAEGQPDPLPGLAPPQRPHPAGDLDAPDPRQPPGVEESATCGPVGGLAVNGTLPGAGAP